MNVFQDNVVVKNENVYTEDNNEDDYEKASMHSVAAVNPHTLRAEINNVALVINNPITSSSSIAAADMNQLSSKPASRKKNLSKKKMDSLDMDDDDFMFIDPKLLRVHIIHSHSATDLKELSRRTTRHKTRRGRVNSRRQNSLSGSDHGGLDQAEDYHYVDVNVPWAVRKPAVSASVEDIADDDSGYENDIFLKVPVFNSQ